MNKLYIRWFYKCPIFHLSLLENNYLLAPPEGQESLQFAGEVRNSSAVDIEVVAQLEHEK